MNILIDTNILIPLEDTGRILDPSLAEMCRISERHGHILYIHPSQAEDIARDRDQARRNIVLSRLRQYQIIPSPPQLSDEELKDYGWKQEGENDRIDNLLLHALCRGAVHFLVTNDKEIHRKARRVEVQEQVHRLDQFLAFLRLQVEEDLPPPYGIQDRLMHEFDVRQPFFDSLREGYAGFNEWYRRVAADHRKAWCVHDNGILHAICIYKEENKPVVVDNGAPLNGRALKLCTFKVGDAARGRKLGERLLFSAFKYAMEHGISYVYLHAYGKEHEMLVSLCQDYGFEFEGKYQDRDDVYLKSMNPPCNFSDDANALSFAIKYYPHYLDSPNVRKFLVPIRPEYHNDLFADTSDNARGLFSNDPSQYSPQSNTIKKAYLCHSKTTQISVGDLLFFYRSHDRRSVECMGVVEQVYRGQDIDKVIPLVSKRTVYSRAHVEIFLERETLIILFRFVRSFPPVDEEDLKKAGIKWPVQSIRKIKHEQYLQCFTGDSIK